MNRTLPNVVGASDARPCCHDRDLRGSAWNKGERRSPLRRTDRASEEAVTANSLLRRDPRTDDVGAAAAEAGMIGLAADVRQHAPAALALLAARQRDDDADLGHLGQGEGAGRRRAL